MMGFKTRKKLVAMLVVLSITGMAITGFAADAPKWVAAIYIQAQKAVGLRWNVVSGATEYKLLRSTTAGTGYEEIASVAVPQYFDKTIEPGTTYYYVLQAVAAGDVSPNSDERSVVIPGKPKVKAVEPPEWDKVTSTASKEFGKMSYKVGLFWKKNPSPNVVAYNIYKSTTKGKDYDLATSTQETKIIDDKVEEGKTYYYVLTALDNQFQETAYSEEKEVKIEKPKDTGPKKKEKKKYPKLVAIPVQEEESRVMPFNPADIIFKGDTMYVAAGKVYSASGFNGELEVVAEYDIIGAQGLGKGLSGELLVVDGVKKEIFVVDDSDVQSFDLPPLEEPLYNPFNDKELKMKDPFPFDVIQNVDGKYWVTDNSNNRVAIFDEDFEFLQNGGEGSKFVVISKAGSLSHDSQGRVFVSSGGNNSVLVYEKDGSYFGQFGEAGNVAGTFSRIQGTAIDGEDNLYVADGLSTIVQKFDREGKFLGAYSSPDGKSGAGLITPNSLYVTEDGKEAYVTEGIMSRIKRFTVIEK